MKFKSIVPVCCAFACLSVAITIAAQARASSGQECYEPILESMYSPFSSYPGYLSCYAACDAEDYPHNCSDGLDWLDYTPTASTLWSAPATGKATLGSDYLIHPGDYGWVTVDIYCTDGKWYSNGCTGSSGQAPPSTCEKSCPAGYGATEVDIYAGVEIEGGG